MIRKTLISCRKNRGWSQQAAARALKISLSHYEKIERGVRNPGTHLKDAIVRLFGEVDQLTERNGGNDVA